MKIPRNQVTLPLSGRNVLVKAPSFVINERFFPSEPGAYVSGRARANPRWKIALKYDVPERHRWLSLYRSDAANVAALTSGG